VDVWSLGVIALDYVYGIRNQIECRRRYKSERTRGLSWCQHIFDLVNDEDEDLKMDPKERLPAAKCLNYLRLFDGQTFNTGSTTPTE
jgi:hypothetical protein